MTGEYDDAAGAVCGARDARRSRRAARDTALPTIIPKAVPLAQSGSTRCAAQVFSRHEHPMLGVVPQVGAQQPASR